MERGCKGVSPWFLFPSASRRECPCFGRDHAHSGTVQPASRGSFPANAPSPLSPFPEGKGNHIQRGFASLGLTIFSYLRQPSRSIPLGSTEGRPLLSGGRRGVSPLVGLALAREKEEDVFSQLLRTRAETGWPPESLCCAGVRQFRAQLDNVEMPL